MTDDSHSRWVAITTSAHEQWLNYCKHRTLTEPWNATDEQIKRADDELKRQRVNYRNVVLSAWRKFYPELDPGQVVPNEVKKLLEEENAEEKQ